MSTMMRLRSWLAPPVFPADEEQTRVAGLLNTILLSIIVGFGLVYTPAALIVADIGIRRWVIAGPICLLALALWIVMRRGHVRFASVALCVGLWLFTTAAIVIGGGLQSPALSGYFIAVLAAGLLVSWRAAIGVAGLSIAACAILLYATLADHLPPPYLIHTPTSIWVTQTILLLLATTLLSLARRSIDEGMRRSRQELAERRRAEAALRASQEEHSRLLHNLHERVKELTALHHAAHILQQGGMGAPALLSDLAALLPPAFQYPEVTAACVRLGDQVATTAAFGDALATLRTDFTTADGAHGSIEVVYTAERPAAAEGPFLAEERQLIESLADMLRTAWDRVQAEAALRLYTRRLEYLRDIDQIILTAPSLDQLAEAVIHRLRTFLPCNRAELFLVDWEAGEVAIVAQASDRPTSVPVGFRYSVADNPPRPALLEGRIVVEHDLSVDVPQSPALQRLWHEGMRARMMVPLLVQGRLIGLIHLTADRPYAPTDDERDLVREMADHLAIGLQHARLLAEVQAANARLQALSRQLVTAQEDERRRIARELHDEIGQALALVKLNIRAVQRTAGAGALAPRLEQSLGVIEDTLLRVRALALDLRPSMLDDLGLVAALRWYVDQQTSLAGLAADVQAADGLGRLPAEIETVCFRVVQEALTNVVRHAQAQSVRVTVERPDTAVDLRIRDDGIGFDATAALALAAQGQSGGLLGMRERVVLCGGRLTVDSIAAHGTTIQAWIPLPAEQ